jgi:predicted NAD/FAD-dependent oxidoreductase
MRVGVVGAGISGLVCARRLLDLAGMKKQSLKVSVFEWGRGAGGRTARRRVQILREEGGEHSTDEVSFDHAAPYFSARTAEFREGLLAQWEARGLCSRWAATAAAATAAAADCDDEEEELWVGRPSNHAIATGLVADVEAAGGEMYFGHHVRAVAYDDEESAWRVRATSRAEGAEKLLSFDALVLSDKLLILPNTYAVLDPESWGEELSKVPADLSSRGAVVLLAAFAQPGKSPSSPTPTPLRRFAPGEHAFLERIIHDSSKPGRGDSSGYDLWVAHSTSEYAQSHLVGEQLDDAEAVKEEMTQALLEAIDADYDNDGASAACDATSQQEGPSRRELVHSSIMAWDHSQPDDGNRLAVPHLFEARRRVGACGDFLQGGGQAEGVEAAALSGLSLAEALGGVLLFDSSHSKKDQ